MNVNAVGSTSGTSTTQPAGASAGQDLSDTFLKLLVTQLKTQDPLSPLDPNQMVGQLAQFNTLSEVIRMRQDLDNISGAATTTSSSRVNSTAGGL